MSDEELIDLNDTTTVAAVAGELPRASRIPYDVYKHRIKEEPLFNPASKSSGLPMLVFTLELIEPEAIVVPGEGERTIAGTEFQYYCSLGKGKTGNLLALHKACGLPTMIGIDPEDGMPFHNTESGPIKIEYTGLELFGTAQSESVEQTKEDADGNPVPILNPYTGEAMTRQRPNFGRVILPPDAA